MLGCVTAFPSPSGWWSHPPEVTQKEKQLACRREHMPRRCQSSEGEETLLLRCPVCPSVCPPALWEPA